ncbi:MAG: FtsX-like permease family protein, partial [Congregibacter sp.]|nr:FtsX-like permease family protein [Congregibacter sp.]
GIVSGRALVDVYLLYFKFPFLIFRLEPAAFVTAFLVSVLAASAGGLLVLRQVFELTPALAMRPPVPVDYSRSRAIAGKLHQVLDQPSRMVLRRIARQPARMLGASVGIAAGMALSVAMIGIMNGFNRTIDLTFNLVDHSDVTVTFNEALSKTAVYDLQHLPGVIQVQPVRNVPVMLKSGLKEHLGALTGLPPNPQLYRALDSSMKNIQLPVSGIILAESLAHILGVKPGDRLSVEVREGRRPTLHIPVAGVARTLLGAPAYMDMDALNRALGEPNRVSGTYLRIDSARQGEIYKALKDMRAIAGVSLKGDTRAALQKQMDSGAGAMRYIMALVAGIITFGIIYNAARIAQAERARDLASLRVMGFTRGETAFVLLGELAIVTLAAIPLGALAGYYLSFAVATGFSTDLYQIPAMFSPGSYGIATVSVLCASLLSGWLVKRDIDKTDLVAALKIRE